MSATKTNSILLLIAISMIACSGDPIEGVAPAKSDRLEWPGAGLTPAEYREWIEDPSHGFVRTKTLGAFIIEARYLTAELKAIQILGDASADVELRRAEAQKYSELEYYSISLKMPEFKDELLKLNVHNDIGLYQQRVQYYGFYAHQDAKLITGGDTIPCAVHNWERTYNAANKLQLEFAFPSSSLLNREDLFREFIFTDRIFGNGPIYFRF
jgi:hypothetical protein